MASLTGNLHWCCVDLGTTFQTLSGSALNVLGNKNGLSSVQDLEILFPEAMEDLNYCQWDGDGHFNMSHIKHLQPPTLGQVILYIRKMVEAASKAKVVLHISSTGHRAVGAVLAGALLVLEREFSAAAAWKAILQACPPPDLNPARAWDRFPPPFCPKGERTSSSVTVLDCLKGLESAKDLGWLGDYRTFDVAAWRLLRKKFDPTWIIPGEMLAMGEPSESAKNPVYPGLLPPSGASSKENTPNYCYPPPETTDSMEMLSDIQTPDGRQQARPPSFLPSKEDLEKVPSTCTSAASSRFGFTNGDDSDFSDSDFGEDFYRVPAEALPSLPASFVETRPRITKIAEREGSSPSFRSVEAKGKPLSLEISQIIPQVARLGDRHKARDLTESQIMKCRDFIELMKLVSIELVLKFNFGFECSSQSEYMCAFEEANVDVVSLAFDDGSVPSKALANGFLKRCRAHKRHNSEDGRLNPIAVHCKAGLGRTGVMLGLYATDHYEIDGQSFHGWVRMCRPGTVQTTEQERFLRKMVPKGKKNRSLSEAVSSILPVSPTNTISRLSRAPSIFRRRTASA